MKDKKTPRNQEGQAPSKGGKDTAKRLEQKADEQKGGSNRARTEEKARKDEVRPLTRTAHALHRYLLR